MEVPTQQVCLALVGIGITSHLTYFIRMPPVLPVPRLVLAAVSAPTVLTLILSLLFRYSFVQAALTASIWYISYLAGVFGSIALYRAFFHPLRRFQGPFLSRMTQWSHVARIWARVDHFRQLDNLHRQYGDFVRAGPNMLSIADPEIVNAVHAPMTKFDKGAWYTVGWPMTTLHQMTNRALHDKRRKHGWDKAFTTKALRSYDSRVIKYSNLLVSQLHKRSGETVDARNWINYFAFDVMGDLAFGKSFSALEKGQFNDFIQLMHDSGIFTGLFGSLPWVPHTFMQIPIPPSQNSMLKFLKMSLDMVEERKAMTPEEPDIMSHILEAGPFYDDANLEKMLLMGDARLLIVAGSDTTATTLTYGLYYMAKHKSLVKKLRDELQQHNIRNDDSLSPLSLTPLDYLNGFITEVLRLHPPVPGGVYREAPKEGITVKGHFIPGGTVVSTPQYTIQRSPKAFVDPDELIPERWTSKPELVLDKSAWFPFVVGRYGCIGKQLALSELRVVVAKLILEFDINFGPGEDGTTLLEDSRDVFTVTCHRLNLIFTPRS